MLGRHPSNPPNPSMQKSRRHRHFDGLDGFDGWIIDRDKTYPPAGGGAAAGGVAIFSYSDFPPPNLSNPSKPARLLGFLIDGLLFEPVNPSTSGILAL